MELVRMDGVKLTGKRFCVLKRFSKRMVSGSLNVTFKKRAKEKDV